MAADLEGRLGIVEVELRGLRESDTRQADEIMRLRDFRHAAGNIVNGWRDFERTVNDLQRGIEALQREVAGIRAANDKLQGPGGAIEQLNQLAEDRRFKRRLLGWAAWVAGIVTSIWAFVQTLWPHIRFPWQSP